MKNSRIDLMSDLSSFNPNPRAYNPKRTHWNYGTAALYEEAIRREEGMVAAEGPLVCLTGEYTGRSPKDKFVVRVPSNDSDVWWGNVNRPMDVSGYESLKEKVLGSLKNKELFVQDCYAGTDADYRLGIRVITEYAWHSLFSRTMFLPSAAGRVDADFKPGFTIINVPSVRADPGVHGTNSEVFIVLNFSDRLIMIGGTQYAGEIKKSIFSVMNYLLPEKDVLPMHCSANCGSSGDVALFFGLSGTGKTTLSSDPQRRLIGDDEHGWSRKGVFNFEGGCYAKMIQLSPQAEPEIYSTTQRFGTVLENVKMDSDTRVLNLDDESLTENTRGAYPISFIDNWEPSGRGGHPENIIMLTADAFGVLPPVSRLSASAGVYHFLSGYTAKVAGTEKGVTEPQATFSSCFGAPFMVRHPKVYAKLLGERISRHDSKVWLVNTGWTGGAYGVGRRMSINHTRAIVAAVLSGALEGVEFQRDNRFNVDIPLSCRDVPSEVLIPRNTWKNGIMTELSLFPILASLHLFLDFVYLPVTANIQID